MSAATIAVSEAVMLVAPSPRVQCFRDTFASIQRGSFICERIQFIPDGAISPTVVSNGVTDLLCYMLIGILSLLNPPDQFSALAR